MSGGVLIGIGNAFRRDDGVGLAVAEEIGKIGLTGVQVVTAIGEPAAMLDVWDGARLAVVVDAAFGDSSRPGEGDPFSGPVAMRLSVGGSWPTVGQTRMG